jgi:signal peptidase II
MKLRDLALPAIALIVLVADQASKFWVRENIPLNTTFDVIPELRDIFVLTHITNAGAAFGLFPQLSIVFTFVAFIVSLVIVFYYRSIPAGQWIVRISLGLQLGGAIGNLIDRLQYGAVTDILYFRFFSPVFNIADSGIVCGVGLLMFHLMRNTQQPEPVEQQPAPSAPADAPEQVETPPGDGLGQPQP